MLGNNIFNIYIMAEPTCNRGTRSRRNCYPQWDNYPCWDEEMKSCYNNEGTTQLFDPLADLLRSLSYVIEYVHNAFVYEIDNIPESVAQEQSRSHYFEFLNDFTTTLQPIQTPTLRNLELIRHYNSDQYLGMAEEYVNRLGDGIRQLRQRGNMNRAVEAIQPPRLERRPSFEQINGGKKKRKRKRKKKTKKNKRK